MTVQDIFSGSVLFHDSCMALHNYNDILCCSAGTLMGFTNGLATIPGFLGPVVVGQLTNGPGMVRYTLLLVYKMYN